MKLLKASAIALACIALGACSTSKIYNDQARKQLEAKGVAFTPSSFIDSASKGNLADVKLFINAGMDVNVYYSSTALSAASAHDKLDVVKYLLEQGADPNIETFYGSALTVAAKNGHLDVVQTLLAAGADPNVDSSDGHSTLSVASFDGNPQVIADLVNAGAEVDYVHPVTGATPLVTASYYGKKDAVLALIKAGANINYVDIRGMSVLDWSQVGSNDEITKLLIENGANIENDKHGGVGKVIIFALSHQDTDMVKYLVQKGIDPNGRAFGSMPLLVWCAKNGLQQSGITLIGLGAKISAVDPVSGSSALDYAIMNGEVDLAKAIDPSINTKLVAANSATDLNLRTQQQVVQDYVNDQYYQTDATGPAVNYQSALNDTGYSKDEKTPTKLMPLYSDQGDLKDSLNPSNASGADTQDVPAVQNLENVLTTQLASDTQMMHDLRSDPVFQGNESMTSDTKTNTVPGLDDANVVSDNNASFQDFDKQISQDMNSIDQSVNTQSTPPPADQK